MDTATKAGLDTLKSVSKKIVHKTAEAIGEFLGNKIANKIIKRKLVHETNSRNVEKIVIPPQTTKEVLNKLSQVL